MLQQRNIAVMSDATGQKETISIARTFPLKRSGSVDQSRSVISQRPSIAPVADPASVFNANQYDGPSYPDASIRDRQSVHPALMEETIATQQRDIDRIDGAVGRIERDMRSFKDFMHEVRKELAELRQLKRSPNQQGIVSVGDFEAIVEDLNKVNNKAHEVDELKEELYSLRARVKKLASANRDRGEQVSDRAQLEPSSGPSYGGEVIPRTFLREESAIQDKEDDDDGMDVMTSLDTDKTIHRVLVRWTIAEEQKLKALKDAGKKWGEIYEVSLL